MSIIELREKWKHSITRVDARFLRMVDALYESYSEEHQRDYEMSDDNKKVLDERLAYHKKNPNTGKDWNVLKEEISKKYDL